jgi:hypothetical protein
MAGHFIWEDGRSAARGRSLAAAADHDEAWAGVGAHDGVAAVEGQQHDAVAGDRLAAAVVLDGRNEPAVRRTGRRPPSDIERELFSAQ